MNKIQRLNKIHKLLKIEEQGILAEFKENQKISHNINMQINDLVENCMQSSNHLLSRPVAINQVILVRQFNDKVELVLEQLHVRLAENDKNFSIVAEKIKQVRTSLTSIERLTEKHKSIENYEQDKHTQKQIEENINYRLSSID